MIDGEARAGRKRTYHAKYRGRGIHRVYGFRDRPGGRGLPGAMGAVEPYDHASYAYRGPGEQVPGLSDRFPRGIAIITVFPATTMAMAPGHFTKQNVMAFESGMLR